MKNFLITLFLTALSFNGFSQCMVEHFTIEKRTQMATYIVEGAIVKKESRWNLKHDFIYTINTIEVYRVFKGTNTASTIEVITEGGQVDMDMITANPSLQLEKGNTGVFLLKDNHLLFQNEISAVNRFEGVASEQSFIQYNIDEQIAYDHHEIYPSIKGSLYTTLKALTKENVILVNPVEIDPWFGKIRPLAPPVITSFNVDTITAGTEEVLTINGSNFGAVRGNGNVQFLDANYGDGRFFIPEYGTAYKSWSDNKIEVYVPSRAGTGKVKVVNGSNQSGTSSFNLMISFSHLNATYGSASVDTQYYTTDHVDDNGKGGYTWQMNPNFKWKTTAVNAFMRSLENWRCGTLMNWDVGNETTVNAISRDNVNLVRHTKFTDSRLGVCYSYWSGCGAGSNLLWYVVEMDIEFDSARSWYYGTGTPSGSQMDFESVATHELGHGHQLGHVIDSKKIMHYSIGPGDRKTVLTHDDITGGNLVMSRSVQSNFCGPNKLVALAPSKCSITKPTAGFKLSKLIACPGDDITATDSSEGIVSTFTWNFGTDATPAIGSGQGPHTFNFSTPGIKTVQLIVVNSFGIDTFSLNIQVNPSKPSEPVPFAHEDSVCKGKHTYSINAIPFADSYLWMLSGGGSIVGSNTDTSLTVNWLITGGPHEARVQALNSCGYSATVAIPVTVFEPATASFSQTIDGRNVTFNNTSTQASTYMWYFGDGDSSAMQHPVHTYPHASSYNVLLKSSNFCSTSEKSNAIQTLNGALVLSFENGTLISYPNPVGNEWTVKSSGLNSENIQLTIADLNGKILGQEMIKSNTTQLLDTRQWNAGVYLVTFKQGEQFIGTQRLIKQ